MKGEPGVPDNSVIESLRENMTRDLQREYMELDDGWVAPFNGYQYKRTPNSQSWDETRSLSQSWGGDLIVHGFRDYAVRETLTRKLSDDKVIWIDLNDKANEGEWRWVNGHRSSTDDSLLWEPDQPSS